MSDCQICGATNDAWLCRRDTDRLAATLGRLPGWLNELTITATQQARTSRHDSSKPTKKFEQPLPYHPDAALLLDQARTGLASIRQHLHRARGIRPRPLPADAAARELRQLIDTIRLDEKAGEIYGKIHDLERAIRSMVDTSATRSAGPCTAVVQPRELAVTLDPAGDVVAQLGPAVGQPYTCGADLRTRPGAKTITCRDCGAVYDPIERAKWVIEKSREHLGTAAFLAAALTDAGRPVKATLLRKWAERGKLFAWRENDLGQPMYLMGDVIDLLDKTAGRRVGDGEERGMSDFLGAVKVGWRYPAGPDEIADIERACGWQDGHALTLDVTRFGDAGRVAQCRCGLAQGCPIDGRHAV